MKTFIKTLARKVRRFVWRKNPTLEYWEKRAADYGERAVLNLGHNDVEQITRWQKDMLFPMLRSELNGKEKIILDYGCGPGRFTPNLAAMINGQAIGVDPVQRLLDLAPPDNRVEYRRIEAGRIPCSTRSVDVIWVCLVLGCIPNETDFQQAVREIDRVLKAGGLLFLVECTDIKPTAGHVRFRSVEGYKQVFPFVPLKVLSSYDDLGDSNTVMAGRKS